MKIRKPLLPNPRKAVVTGDQHDGCPQQVLTQRVRHAFGGLMAGYAVTANIKTESTRSQGSKRVRIEVPLPGDPLLTPPSDMITSLLPSNTFW